MNPSLVTARDFYASLTTIWLFLLLIALRTAGGDGGWTSYVLPVGTLVMLGLHGSAWRRHQSASGKSTDTPSHAR